MYHPDKVGQQGAGKWMALTWNHRALDGSQYQAKASCPRLTVSLLIGIVETFVSVRAAHEILVDPVTRMAYDRFGPNMLSCQGCKTNKDFINNGLSSYYTFYLGSGVVLVLMSVLGKGQFARYWRFIVLFGMAALELAMILRPTPITLLSWIMPHRVTFEQVAILHQVFISTFIAISQIGPILVPSKENERGSVKDLLTRLEMLTVMSSKLPHPSVYSCHTVSGRFKLVNALTLLAAT